MNAELQLAYNKKIASLTARIGELERELSKEREWISVEDRLPENHERCLCRAVLSNCFVDAVCLFDKDSQFYRWLYENKEVEVTH